MQVNGFKETYSPQLFIRVKLHPQISEHLPIHLFLSQDVPQVLQERQGDQGMGMTDLHIPRYCLNQPHKILQF